MPPSAGISKTNKKISTNTTERWTRKETLCFLKLLVKNRVFQVIHGHKVHDIFDELKVQMKNNGFNKTCRQMEIKLKSLQKDYQNTNRTDVPSVIDKHMKDLNFLFGCGPKDIADLYGGLRTDSDKDQYKHSTIMENGIAKEMETSDTTRLGVVEVRLPEKLEDNQKQNTNNGQSSNVKMLNHQPTFQMDMLNEILERQQSFMIQVLENQKKLYLEIQAKYNENLKSQSKVLMDGFLSGLKLIQESKK